MRRWIVWLVLGLALTAMLSAAAAVVTWKILASRTSGPIVYSPASHPTSPWRGTSTPTIEDEEPDETPKLPAVKRSIPIFQPHLLDGCSLADLDAVERGINDAIARGAPLYNDGDFAGCYRTYETAAQMIERAAASACKGPASALKSGRERATKRDTAAEQAWAMRDTFDGLLDVIGRKGPEL